MNNTTFKPIPKNDEFKIPLKLTQNLLVDWLLTLSNYGSKEACLQILYLLQILNKSKLPVKTRISFLKTINDYLEQYVGLLENSCWDASFPLSEPEQDYAQIITWNYLVLGEGFYIAAEQSSNRDDGVFVLYMALHAMGKAQLHIAATYNNPADGFWILVYKIFARAEEQRLLDLEINETDLKDITVNTVFAQLVIFHICDMRQFQPKEMQSIFNFLLKACDKLSFYKLTDIRFQTDMLEVPYFSAINTITYRFKQLSDQLAIKIMGRQDLFILDLKKDSPPIINDSKINHVTIATRYFCPGQVANHIHQLIETGGLWNGILKALNNELFRRVAKVLEPGQKRKYQREKENKSLLGVMGFESIISFLYKTTKKDSFEKAKPVAESMPAFSTYEDLKNYADNLKKSAVLLADEYADFELSYKFRYPENKPNNIWQSNKHLSKSPNKKVFLRKISISDSSTKGYSVAWDEHSESVTRVGNIFGIISEDKKRLEIALIRRIAINQGNDFIFGSEVLGFKSELVYINQADSETSDEDTGEWAIFVPSDEKLEQFDSLIYNSSHFKVGDVIFLHRNDRVILCSLMKELHSEATISHVELKY
jgi:hypothetical protein